MPFAKQTFNIILFAGKDRRLAPEEKILFLQFLNLKFNSLTQSILTSTSFLSAPRPFKNALTIVPSIGGHSYKPFSVVIYTLV